MSAFVDLQNLIATVAARLGLPGEDCAVHMAPRDGLPFHFVARGDRFDLVALDKGKAETRAQALGLEDAAYEVLFLATLKLTQAKDQMTKGAALSRWNWMGPQIALMEAASPAWGARCHAHYRQVLEAVPLSPTEIDAIRPGLLRPPRS